MLGESHATDLLQQLFLYAARNRVRMKRDFVRRTVHLVAIPSPRFALSDDVATFGWISSRRRGMYCCWAEGGKISAFPHKWAATMQLGIVLSFGHLSPLQLHYTAAAHSPRFFSSKRRSRLSISPKLYFLYLLRMNNCRLFVLLVTGFHSNRLGLGYSILSRKLRGPTRAVFLHPRR